VPKEEPRFVEVAQRARDVVPVDPFVTPQPLHVVDQDVGTRRGEPEYLAVVDLEATPGLAPFALKNPDPAKKYVDQINAANAAAVANEMPDEATMPGRRRTTATQRRNNARAQAQGSGLLGRLAGGEDGGPVAGILPDGGEGVGLPMGDFGGGTAGPRGVQAPPDSEVKGVRWICVTGLVPSLAQRDKYFNEFSTAQFTDPAKDQPVYAGYLVERAEVTSSEAKDPKLAVWKPISVSASRDFAKTWAMRSGDVVDPIYTHEELTFPLGPILEKSWGKEVAHSKLPLLDITQRGAAGAGMTPEEPDTIADIDRRTNVSDLEAMKERLKKQLRTQDPNSYGSGMSRMPAATRSPMPRSYPGASSADGGEGVGLPGAGRSAYSSGDGGEYASTSASPEGQEVEHLLFRFFDFSVEEGKSYMYRVQLVLLNPNYGVRPQYLKDSKLAVDDFRYSPKSEPSPVVSAPAGDSYLLAGKVWAAEKPTEEPKANLIAVQLDPKLGTKAVYEMRPPRVREKIEFREVGRGQLIRFSAKVSVVHPILRIPKEETVEFKTDRIVIDIRGGERFNPNDFKDRDTAPGEVLTMDSSGQLWVNSEVADEPDYLAEAAWLEQLRLAKETNQQVPADGAYPTDGGEGTFPPRRGRATDGS
jgi:hypothetical protein